MKSSVVTLVLIIIVIAVAGWFTYRALHPDENAGNSEAARSLVGDDAGNKASYLDLDGQPVDLQEFAGRVRVVNSWATWSPFSRNELEALGQLANEANDEVVVIAINRAETAAKVKSYLSKTGKSENIIYIIDNEDRFYDSVGGYAMPETIFYDRKGHIVFHKRGVMELDEMKKYLEEALNSSQE